MDTRGKILTLAEAAKLKEPVAMITGYFDILRAELVHDLDRLHDRNQGAKLLAVVLPNPDEILPRQARAELVAALRVIDYVVISDTAAARRLAASIEPVEVSHLETDDARRARELKEHVHRRQT